MSTVAIIALLAVILVAVIAWLQYRVQAGGYQPLANRKPASSYDGTTPLGMEATDLDVVERAQRRNESLERASTSFTRGKFGRDALSVRPWADDETYAKRFHAAFKGKTKGPKT